MKGFLLKTSRLGRRFRHRGKSYCWRSAGLRTLALLIDIETDPACQSARGLLRLRPSIRNCLGFPTPVALCYLIDRANHTRSLRLAIWLLGRIGNPYATLSVRAHINHADFRVRREVIRSLHRLHAWTELRRIAVAHHDPRTRAIAKPSEPRPYTDRLGKFVAHSEALKLSNAPKQLVIASGVEFGAGQPPKSHWRIRSVLRRIRRLVRRPKRRRRCPTPGTAFTCFSRAH